MDIIEVKNLYKSFMIGEEQVDILKDISFTIEEGEFVSIMGPSGVGKSTLLYLLGGLDKPSKGSIQINNKNLSKIKEIDMSKMRRREIGFVFQFYNLVSNLTVKDNICLPLLLDGKKLKKHEDKVNEIIEYLGLSDRINMTPRELSGGQQQRVAIARTLVYDPNIIFLDEPIGNLDSKTGIEIMELFKKINQDMNKTIIQVTHSEQSALYGTCIYRMIDGTINTIEYVKNK